MKKNSSNIGIIVIVCLVCIAPLFCVAQEEQEEASSIVPEPPDTAVEEAVVSLPYLCVRGIMSDDEQPYAIVNEHVVGRGDSVDGVQVADIGDSYVEFEFQGALFRKQIGEGCGSRLISSSKQRVMRSKNVKVESFGEFLEQIPFEELKESGAIDELMKQVNFEEIRAKLGSVLLVFAIFMLGLYAFTSISFQMIATKTETPNGWLAWIPIVNIYLLCRIAKRPGWWFFVILLLPVVNIILSILLFIGIAEARGKSSLLGLAMCIPVIQLFVLGYLAFSE